MPNDKWFKLIDRLFGVGQLVCAALIFITLIYVVELLRGAI